MAESTEESAVPSPPPRRRVPMSLIFGMVLILLTGGVLVTYNYALFRSGQLGKARNIPPIKQLPAFVLVDENGEPFAREDMAGKVWLADFIFTRCPGPCLRLSEILSGWQRKVEEYDDVQLVSFTVDPGYDTPEVLTQYAARFNARPGKWKFITGPPDAQLDLVRDGFMLMAAEQKDPERAKTEGAIIHSSHIVLVDQNAMIRGYYQSDSPEAMEKLMGDVLHLLKQGGM